MIMYEQIQNHPHHLHRHLRDGQQSNESVVMAEC